MANINSQQILVPKKVYIGDSAELRISLNSSQEILNFNWLGDLNLQDYSIQNVQITKSGLNYYQITINFVPWKTGEIHFPKMELITHVAETEVAGVSDKSTETSENLIIKTEPVQIVSLVEQNQITGLRGSSNPMLIPGTTYKLYGALIGIVLLLIALIRLIIKRKKIILAIQHAKQQRIFRRNKRHTLRALNSTIQGNSQPKTDKEFASAIQSIMRKYLEIRFDYPFTKVVSSEIFSMYKKIVDENTVSASFTENPADEDNSTANNSLNEALKEAIQKNEEEKLKAAEYISETFIKTDYVRYGNMNFQNNDDISERVFIIENLIKQIEILESPTPKVVDIH